MNVNIYISRVTISKSDQELQESIVSNEKTEINVQD